MSEYIVRETGSPGVVKQEIVGELVRCKDCKYYKPPFEVDGMEFEGDCDFHEWYRAAPSENDFCSRGVRENV